METKDLCLSRCPQCHTPPDLFMENKAIYLHCPLHGHVARGQTHSEAIQNWNIYIAFIKADTIASAA
jgi:hypothetical protein